MNDVSMLAPLPAALAAPVVATIEGDGMPLVSRGLFAGLVLVDGDIAPKDGRPFAYEDMHVVALRFDLCDRSTVGTCPEADGRLRLVLQPVYQVGGETLAHDIAVHAFYPIPQAELGAVISELRVLAGLGEVPLDARLGVSPALARGDVEYRDRLRALVMRYARWDRIVRFTVLGQDARSAAFAWILRGADITASATTAIAIPDLETATEQHVLVAGGDTIYDVTPVADEPRGFATAINGALFAAATPAEKLVALEAMSELQNPTRHDAIDTQCIGCHVSTFLMARRAAAVGIDPAALEGHYGSRYDTSVDGISIDDARVLRGFGWASRFPAISQRVANDTAQVLVEIEQRFPLR